MTRYNQTSHKACHNYSMFIIIERECVVFIVCLNLTLNQLINQNLINKTGQQQTIKKNTPFSSTKIITNVIRPWGKIKKKENLLMTGITPHYYWIRKKITKQIFT